MPPLEPALRSALLASILAGAASAQPLTPDRGGTWERWTIESIPTRSNEITHAILLPPSTQGGQSSRFEGRVMLITNATRYGEVACEGVYPSTITWLWDPRAPAVAEPVAIPNPSDGSVPLQELWCCGHTVLPNGDVLAVGGTEVPAKCYTGSRVTWRWSSAVGNWTFSGLMHEPRWYPTALTMADGKVLITGHVSFPSPADGSSPYPIGATHEVYDPATWQLAPRRFNEAVSAGGSTPTGAIHDTFDYPWLHQLACGAVMQTGPYFAIKFYTRIGALDRRLDRWRLAPPSQGDRNGGNSVHLLTWRGGARRETIYVIGGQGRYTPVNSTDATVTSTVERIADPGPASNAVWQRVASMHAARRHHNTVILPTGKLLVLGGKGWDGAITDERTPELYDPDTDTWTRLNPQADPRGYHSIGMLLPSGHVASAGGVDAQRTVEVFLPPHMWTGAGPLITSAPSTIAVQPAPTATETFTMLVTMRTAGDAPASVCVIRSPSVTHGINPDQRYVELAVHGVRHVALDTWELVVRRPEDNFVCPPGWYMLFCVTLAERQSHARWVHVR